MDKEILKAVMADDQKEVESQKITERDINLNDFSNCVLVGSRRAGKSFLLYQKIQQLLREGKKWDEMLYLNFEDERLDPMQASDLNQILETHMEVYGKRPTLFLDEIQNIDGWEKFARRLADNKYRVYITGSNAKMLSSEIQSTLGGRYIPLSVFPYSFAEFLTVNHIDPRNLKMLSTEAKASIVRNFNFYLHEGGFPETVATPAKRDYVNSVYQKIIFGDIAVRSGINNMGALRILIKKLAESVRQPIAFKRMANVVMAAGRKLSANTAAKYIDTACDAWLLIPVGNIAARLSDRESKRKYYFTDNGLLNLFLVNQDPGLLENLAAISLIRKYGRDDEVFFCTNQAGEIDFYVPNAAAAYQVCYSVADAETLNREIKGFDCLPSALPCSNRTILTYNDAEVTVQHSGVGIKIMPMWKWLLTDMAQDA